MWDLQSTLLGPNVLAGSDTIYNRPSSLLANIVRFYPLHITVSLTILKHLF